MVKERFGATNVYFVVDRLVSGAFKASCDCVAVYFQNAKHLLKSAFVTTLIIMGLTLLAWLVPFLLIGAICSLLDVTWWISALISVLIAAMLKVAFVDSFLMVKTMVSYMEVAPSTEITFT